MNAPFDKLRTALWRGEMVTVVSVKNGKVQIAWRRGLRWVRVAELAKVAA